MWRALIKMSETAAGLSALLVTARHLLAPPVGMVGKVIRLALALLCLGLAVVAAAGLLRSPEGERTKEE